MIFPTKSQSKSYFVTSPILQPLFLGSFYLKFLNGCNFLIFKAKNTFFSRKSQNKFAAAAAVLGSCQPPQSSSKIGANFHEILIGHVDTLEKLKSKIKSL